MKAREGGTWGSKARVASAVLGFVIAVLAWEQYAPSCGSARTLRGLTWAETDAGERVLVAQEVLELPLDQRWVRYDVLDPRSGEIVRRIAPWLWEQGGEERSLLGGSGARVWWADRWEPVLIDVGVGLVADKDRLLALNPELRGEIGGPFTVDAEGALIVMGGDGARYRIDIAALRARPHEAHAHTRSHVPPRVRDAVGLVRANLSLPQGELVRVCETWGPGARCDAELRDASRNTIWKLDARPDGLTVLDAEAHDAHTAYLYLANEDVLSAWTGGVFLYAVDVRSGRVRWSRKL